MMKMGAVSGVMCVVEDLDRTVEYYEVLGFDFKKLTDDYAIGYVNWFWVEFAPKDKVEKPTFEKLTGLEAVKKGAGTFLHMSVDDVDDFFQMVVDAGLKPASEPKDFPWGRREFILIDPDGYKLVFFSEK